MMALISFSTRQDHLQNPHSLLSDLLMGQEDLHYRDMCYLPLQHTLKMQHVPFTYFTSLVSENHFQPEGTTMDPTSHTTAIFLVFLSDDQHETIKYIHIGLVVCCASCHLYEQKAIPWLIKSIEYDLKKARSKWAAGKDPSKAHSFSMFVGNFGGLMAVPTDPPYCLVYSNIYYNEVPPEDKTHACICCSLLWHADLSEAHRQNYHESHLVIPWGAQYSHLLPKITMLHNHQVLLIDLHSREPFPMVPVGDFQLVDKIFPGMPRDSLLFNSDNLTKLQKMRFQIPTYLKEWLPGTESKVEKPQSTHTSGEAPSSTNKEGEPLKSRGKSPWAPSPRMSTDSPSRKSLCHSKHPPTSKEHHDTCEKDSHGSSFKHWDKPYSDMGSKDKESSKTPQKHVASPSQRPSSTEWAEKEPNLKVPSLTFNASSQSWHSSPSRHLSETDDQASFVGPNSTSTPNKTEGGPHV